MKTTRAKTVLLLFPVLCVTGLVVFGTGCKKSGPELKIGVIAELTGDIPAIGNSAKRAAELAVGEINEAGGVEVAGTTHPLRLVIEDSGGKPEPAVEAAKRLIEQEKVIAIVGPNASLGAVPAAKVAEAERVLMLSPGASAPALTLDETGKPRRYVYRACFTDAFGGKALAKFAYGYMRATKAAILYNPGSDAPKSQTEEFKKDFEAGGGAVVAVETYAQGDKDFTAQLTKIKAAGPDLLFLPSYYSEVGEQLKQIRAAGIKCPVLGSDNWTAPELIQKSGADVEGTYFSAHYSPDAMNDTVAKFRASFEKKFNKETPDDVAALTYDAFGLLKMAFAGAKSAERDALRDAFAALTTYEGVTGKLTYRGGSPDPIKSVVMKQFKGKKAIFVTNIDPY